MASIDRVTRPASARIAACLAGVVVAGFGPLPGSVLSPGTGYAAGRFPPTPLQVSMDSMSPPVIPANGTVTVTGEITNTSEEVWRDLNVYLLTSAAPIRASTDLAAASRTDPASEIGDRLTAAELYDPLGDLQPGSSAGYTLSVNRTDLQITGAPGVYWLGVHVLGANGDGRDTIADGRARTFVPLMDADGPETSLALVMPIRADVQRRTDGRLRRLSDWQRMLEPEGRLDRLLQLSETARQQRLTWILDPAVLDAVRTVAEDNPSRRAVRQRGGRQDTGAGGAGDDTEDQQSGADPTGSPSEEGDDAGEPAEDSAGAAQSPELSPQAKVAAKWLRSFRRQSAEHTVLTVPYGDLDVASVLRRGFVDLYEEATDLSAETMEAEGIEARPVIAPSNGYLPRVAFPRLTPDQDALLSQRAVPGAPNPVVLFGQHRILLEDTSTQAGGPSPTPPFRALALRQRILAEAAVHALSADREEPLVVSTPQSWNPASDWRSAKFFAGLRLPWLRSVDLPTAAVTGAASNPAERDFEVTPVYPRAARRAELPRRNALAAERLDRTGKIYANLLSQDDTVDELVSRSAMLAVGAPARERPKLAARVARATTARIRAAMARVHIEGPSFVTMSSEEGTLAITLVNDLDEPVTVGVKAVTTTNDLEIPSPDPVSLGPGQRASVKLRANASDIGVHPVSLVPTNGDGQALGNPVRFNVRTSQVGLVIWAVMGVGAGVLFVTIAVRLLGRLRDHRRRREPLDEMPPPEPSEPEEVGTGRR